MASFEFVGSSEYRACLERDAEELVLCLKAGAWRSALAMASSLIQASLVEYLSGSGICQREQAAGLGFKELLELAEREGVITARTLELARFLRPYTDALSPVPEVRTEASTDEIGARIAQALFELVLNEIAGRRAGEWRVSAEKVVAKLQHDSGSLAILPNLLRKLGRAELEKLLVDLLPKAYLELLGSDAGAHRETLARLSKGFRKALEQAPPEVKKGVAEKYVAVLENESEFVVGAYQRAFFRAKDLEYLSAEARQTVKAHFLDALARQREEGLLDAAEGIGRYLADEEEARKFLMAMLAWMADETDPEKLRVLEQRVRQELDEAPRAVREYVRGLAGRMRRALEKERRPREAAILQRLWEGLGAAAAGA